MGTHARALATVAVLALTFLASAGGFVSLAQMTVAGVAGYAVASLAADATPLGFGRRDAAAIPAALGAATLAGLLIGAVAVRTQGIYLLLITLAPAMGITLSVQSNTALLCGFEGIRGIVGPVVLGLPRRDPKLFWFAALIVAAACYPGLVWLLLPGRGVAAGNPVRPCLARAARYAAAARLAGLSQRAAPRPAWRASSRAAAG